MPRTFYVGCYTAGAGGTARGIEVVTHDPGTGAWTILPAGVGQAVGSDPVPAASPSYLAWHPDGRHLYAVAEVPDGKVLAFEVGEPGDPPRLIGSSSTGGAHPCHLAVDPSGAFLVSANYGSGSLSVHPILADGSLGERSDLLQHNGSGPDEERQAGPHAHMACFAGDNLLLAVDLGVDGVGSYRLEPITGRLTAAPTPWSSLPPGFGPRHLVLLPEHLVAVAGELTGEIALMRLDPVGGGLTLLHRVPGTATGQPSSPSGLARTPDGRFVLMANRGPDTVSAFEVLRDASDGPPRLVLVDEIGCGGHNPRDITLIDGTVYVANQGSGSIAVLGIDPDTGALTVAGATLALPSPTHLLPSPAQVEEQP